MAFLTTGNFYEVDFHPSTDASWAALGSFPNVPASIMQAVVTGATRVVYVIDSALGQFAFEGGSAIGFDDSVLSATSAALTDLVTTADDGYTWTNALDSGGDWWIYDVNAGVLRKFDVAEKNALQAFL